MGYGGVINHGVYTYQLIAHELVRRLGHGDPTSLKEISARFAGPVTPGDEVGVDIWKIGTREDGSMETRWMARVVSTGRVCLSEGIALIQTGDIYPKI